MKNAMFCGLSLVVLSSACASDGPHESVASSDDLSSQVAFYGLTVMDCQQQASQCAQASSGKSFFSNAVSCSGKLRKCLAKAGAEIAKGAVEETKQLAACGVSGADCLGGAHKLSAALACENGVETCVVNHVHEVTGIALPTTQQVAGQVVEEVGHVAETATEVVHTAVEVTHEVVDTTAQVADHAIDTTVHVAEHAVETATDVAGHAVTTTAAVADHVVDTGVKVTTEVVDTAADVVKETVDTAAGTVKSALQCAEESRSCIRTTKKLVSCQLTYAECMASAI